MRRSGGREIGCTGLGATRSRKTKVAVLAEVLGRAGADEVGPAAAFLSGQLRQGRVGVGWALLSAVDVAPAAGPTITVGEVDRAVGAGWRAIGLGPTILRVETAGLAGCSTLLALGELDETEEVG